MYRLGSFVNGPEIWNPLYTFKQIGFTWTNIPMNTRIIFTRLIVKNFRSFSNHVSVLYLKRQLVMSIHHKRLMIRS